MAKKKKTIKNRKGYVLKKGASGKRRWHKKGEKRYATSEPNLKGGVYTKGGKRYTYSPKRDAKIKAKRKGRAWRGDTHYSKKYKGWI